MKKKIILIGGGGHCKSCIDVIEIENKIEIAGIIDQEEKLHLKVLGYEVIGCDEDLPQIVEKYKNFLITIGQIKNVNIRIDKFELLKKLGAYLPIIISPLAYVSKNSFIDEGSIVMHKSFVNSNVNIGKNCSINTGSIIEHDVTIGNHSHISTGSIINGGCNIGEKVFIGSNSTIVNNINIVEKAIIGAGAVVTKSIKEAGIYIGNPARKLNKNE